MRPKTDRTSLFASQIMLFLRRAPEPSFWGSISAALGLDWNWAFDFALDFPFDLNSNSAVDFQSDSISIRSDVRFDSIQFDPIGINWSSRLLIRSLNGIRFYFDPRPSDSSQFPIRFRFETNTLESRFSSVDVLCDPFFKVDSTRFREYSIRFDPNYRFAFYSIRTLFTFDLHLVFDSVFDCEFDFEILH